jgi:hypothetical protein
VLSFVAYVSGLLPGVVPVDRLPELWSLPVAQFLARTQMPTGWGWLALLGHGDVLGLLGIALLAGVSVPCLLALVPIYCARGDKAFVRSAWPKCRGGSGRFGPPERGPLRWPVLLCASCWPANTPNSTAGAETWRIGPGAAQRAAAARRAADA